MTESPIPYLASVRWYAAYVSALLEGKERAPRLPAHFNRTEVLAPFGLRQLSVPIEGGRRIISPRRYEELRLSEHGGWRHTHWQTITSAYGSAPYFHYMEDRFRAIYERRYDLLGTLCRELHRAVCDSMRLDEAIEGLRSLPDPTAAKGRTVALPSPEISILHLLFYGGPESVFTLLRFNSENGSPSIPDSGSGSESLLKTDSLLETKA